MLINQSIVYNKTMDKMDFLDTSTSSMKKELSWYSKKLFLRGIPFAVNGVLKRRYYIRWYKMWEYARSLAYLDMRPKERVLDFGGAATLPVFYLAQKGCEVISVDINEKLTEHTNRISGRMGWKLNGSTVNLCEHQVPAEWGIFDYVITFCTIEHLNADCQHSALRKMAGLLADGGVMVITFDYGQEAPTESPLRSTSDVERLIRISGLKVVGNYDFLDTGTRFRLRHRKRHYLYTFGSLFLKK